MYWKRTEKYAKAWDSAYNRALDVITKTLLDIGAIHRHEHYAQGEMGINYGIEVEGTMYAVHISIQTMEDHMEMYGNDDIWDTPHRDGPEDTFTEEEMNDATKEVSDT